MRLRDCRHLCDLRAQGCTRRTTQRTTLHHYWRGKGSVCIYDYFTALVAVPPCFPCTLIGETRQDDVHEQQTAALRHASLFTRAQVHHPAFQLGSYKKSLSTNSTGKSSPKNFDFVLFFVPRLHVALNAVCA